MLRQRASIILENDGSLLLVRRQNKQGLYYVFPGGGIKAGESVEQAAVREMREEGGIEIEARQVVLHTQNDLYEHFFVQCRQLDGKQPLWQEKEKISKGNTYQFEWLPLDQISGVTLFPIEGCEAIKLLGH